MDQEKGYIFNIQHFSLHDGSGIRTDFFFAGCNLRCKWCSNPESQKIADSDATEYTVEELVKEAKKDRVFYDKSGGGVTLTGGEVFMQREFAVRLCKALSEEGISTAIETAGCVESQKFWELVDAVDFVFMDCKHYDSQKHKAGTGRPNEQILQNMKELASSGKEYCIRIPVIPKFNDSLEDAKQFGALFNRLGVRNVQILPFHQFGEKKYEQLKKQYAYSGVAQMHKEDLYDYQKVLQECGIKTQIGG